MTLKTGYFIVLGICLIQRVFELWLSRRNCARLVAAGFQYFESQVQFASMVSLHTFWFVALILEPLLFPQTIPPSMFVMLLACFSAAQLLRLWSILSLKEYWNITVMSLPSDAEPVPVITSGPYRFIRHPNYLAVIVEFLTLPLMAGAWRSALLFSYLNLILLFFRINREERYLQNRPGYREKMEFRGTFLPSTRLILREEGQHA